MYYRLRIITGGNEWNSDAQVEADTVCKLQKRAKKMVQENPQFVGETYSIAKITGHTGHEFATTVKSGVIGSNT